MQWREIYTVCELSTDRVDSSHTVRRGGVGLKIIAHHTLRIAHQADRADWFQLASVPIGNGDVPISVEIGRSSAAGFGR